MHKMLFCLALLLPVFAFSQDEELVNYDNIYVDNIRSVKFHVYDMLTSMPVLGLSGGGTLQLSFDDMDAEAKNYVYTVQHCDVNWQPSNLNEFDYIDGFSEGQIQDYEFSFKVATNYTHYWLELPNQNMQFRISGNYLLKVYEDEDDKTLVLTRRFLVLDNKMTVDGKSVRPAWVDKINTHHEIDFSVKFENTEVRNPQQEFTAVVLQNGRWDNAIMGLKPLFLRQNTAVFDYQDKVVFPAGKEFRFLDLRSTRYPDPLIVSLTRNDAGGLDAVLEKDKKRGDLPYIETFDINGNFVIENLDLQNRNSIRSSPATAGFFLNQLSPQEESSFDDRLARTSSAQERAAILQERATLLNERALEANAREEEIYGSSDNAFQIHHLQSEYIDVLFQLASVGEMDDEDIYLFGGFTDWQLKPEFKMSYNPATNSYVAKALLKQGYYEYLYAALPHGKDRPDFEVTEGDYHETNDYYTILIYQRPFGGRYDQLVGAASFSSRRQ